MRSDGDGRLGLTGAGALVLGTIIGTGIFTLPAVLAPYGTVSLLALAIVSLGALTLALVFGRLAGRMPDNGGPYVYARSVFGDFSGFLTAWSYWISGWAGNAAIAVAWVGYVNEFIPVLDRRWSAVTAALLGIWLPAVVNLAGVRSVNWFQSVTTVAKFAALLLVGVGGLFFVSMANFGPFDATGVGWLAALSAASALLLFSYIGVETAAIAAGVVRDPARNVGRATVVGTLSAAVVYLLGTVVVFGTVGTAQLVDSTAPFADAVNAMLGGTAGGAVMSAVAVVSGFGALVGWTLVTAEMSAAAAEGGVFPRVLAAQRRGVPWVGIVVSSTMASLLTITNFTGGLSSAFTSVVLLSAFTVVIPYLLSAAAQLYWLATNRRAPGRRRDFVIAVAALLFSYWMIAGAGYQSVYKGLLMLLAGIPVYVLLRARTSRV